MIYITVVYAILIFVVLILVHEGGHFLAAKACGVQVNEFAIGLGPVIYKKRFGETDYAVRILPFGGQCVMEGEDEGSSNPRAFNNAPAWKRFIILVAGVTMNFIMGLLIFFFLFIGQDGYVTPVIEELMPKFTAAEDILPGDRIVSINGYHIFTVSDISTALDRNPDHSYKVVVKRDGRRVSMENVFIEPQPYEEDGETVYYYGFRYRTENSNIFTTIKNAFHTSINMVRLVIDSLKMLLRGQVSVNDMSGPVGITATMSSFAKESMYAFWYLAGLIAINLAVMNLLPIPALDGGRVLVLIIEAIIGKKLNPKAEGIMNFAVFVLLLGFMLFITFNDIRNLIR